MKMMKSLNYRDVAQIDKTYHELLNEILFKGFSYEDPNRKGINRIQIPSYTFKHDFKDGFPAITTKKLFWKGVVGELIWFLRGDTNIKYLVDNRIHIWDKDAYNHYLKQTDQKDTDKVKEEFNKGIHVINHKAGNLGRVYGSQWRDWTVHRVGANDSFPIYVDQISKLIRGLRKNPMGTRHIVTAWNPAELDDMALPPCHWSFEILVEPTKYYKGFVDEGEEEYQFTLKWHQRSVDTFLGLPFNLASYALLAHIIGKMTNMIPKGIIGDLSNVHIYKPHLEAVKEQLSRNVNEYGSCELDMNDKFVYQDGTSISKCVDLMKISDFRLKDYQSYSYIKADMLAYNK